MKEHISSVHEKIQKEKCYTCDKCDKAFAKPYNLALHVRTVHENIRNLYKCDQCEKEFTNKSALNDHIDIIHNNIRYECQHCQKFFTSTRSLENHINIIHFPTEEVFEFEHCGKTF